MKLVFEKNSSGNHLIIKTADKEQDFDYIVLLKHLIAGEELEESDFIGVFSSEERQAVDAMIEKIKKAVSETNEEECFDCDEEEIRVENIPF
jgi:hypothetical protein